MGELVPRCGTRCQKSNLRTGEGKFRGWPVRATMLQAMFSDERSVAHVRASEQGLLVPDPGTAMGFLRPVEEA